MPDPTEDLTEDHIQFHFFDGVLIGTIRVFLGSFEILQGNAERFSALSEKRMRRETMDAAEQHEWTYLMSALWANMITSRQLSDFLQNPASGWKGPKKPFSKTGWKDDARASDFVRANAKKNRWLERPSEAAKKQRRHINKELAHLTYDHRLARHQHADYDTSLSLFVIKGLEKFVDDIEDDLMEPEDREALKTDLKHARWLVEPPWEPERFRLVEARPPLAPGG